MSDSIYKWSLTAAENDAADPAVNWRENQLPDTVNDSGRAMMMRVAEFREDLTGGLVTAGTQPAYTVTTKAAFDSLAAGRIMTVRIHATNTAVATLNVNGLGAKSIRKFTINGDLPVSVGDLQLGNLYQFMYAPGANAGAGGWIIPAPSGGTAFPAGTAMLFMQAAAPLGWTKLTTNDNAAIRIVAGAGGTTGGTMNFTDAFKLRTLNASSAEVVLTAAQLPSHTHTQQGSFGSGGISANHYHGASGNTGGSSANHSHSQFSNSTQKINAGNYGSYGGNDGGQTGNFSADHTHYFSVNTGNISVDHSHATTISGQTGAIGGGLGHSHTLTITDPDFSVKYVDGIICTKD